jgi:hypothetical protein
MTKSRDQSYFEEQKNSFCLFKFDPEASSPCSYSYNERESKMHFSSSGSDLLAPILER